MPDENTTERDPASLLDRRGVLALPLGLACGSLVTGCASARSAAWADAR